MNKSHFNFSFKILTISALIVSCTNKNIEQNSNPYAATDSVDSEMPIPLNPNLAKSGTTKNKKFIRTADSKFRVKDVKKTSQKIQELTGKYGGYVTNMALKSEPSSTNTIQISEDSLAEINTFSVHNDITIRVPNQQMDSLLRDVFKLVEYWDNCEIKADEISLSLLSNSLKINRLDNFSERNKGNIDKKKGNITVASDAEENVLEHQNQADDFRVQQQNLADQVEFSTINLHIYQPSTTTKTSITNPKSIELYQPNLFLRLFDSLKDGWVVLEELLVFLFKFWVLFVGGTLAYFLAKKYKK